MCDWFSRKYKHKANKNKEGNPELEEKLQKLHKKIEEDSKWNEDGLEKLYSPTRKLKGKP